MLISISVVPRAAFYSCIMSWTKTMYRLLYKDALPKKRRSGVVSQSLLACGGNCTWQGVYGLADNSYSVRLSTREQVSHLPDHCAAEAGSEMRLFCLLVAVWKWTLQSRAPHTVLRQPGFGGSSPTKSDQIRIIPPWEESPADQDECVGLRDEAWIWPSRSDD